MRQRYGDFAAFCETFAPSKQDYMAAHDVYVLCSPVAILTPPVVDSVYGIGAFVDWLSMQLAYFYAAVNHVTTLDNCKQQARNLAVNYAWLKVPEWQLFLSRIRAGAYGESFGRWDVTTIGKYVKNHNEWRTAVMPRYRSEYRRRYGQANS